jgi:hypothetical protein
VNDMAIKKALYIQWQPELANDLEMAKLAALLGNVVDTVPETTFDFEAGNDQGPYVTFRFQSSDLNLLWNALRQQIYELPGVGEVVATSTIAVCEGEHGWNDYLTLHHFDSGTKTDSFRGH